jgi:hypothetical protein
MHGGAVLNMPQQSRGHAARRHTDGCFSSRRVAATYSAISTHVSSFDFDNDGECRTPVTRWRNARLNLDIGYWVLDIGYFCVRY